jgi:hypothetical protein
LERIKYNTAITEYLVNGFEQGFPIDHFHTAYDVQANNTSAISEAAGFVRTKLDTEVKAGRIAGPFSHPPFSPFQVSPLNIREKKPIGTQERKFRLLHNLSFPYDSTSVNANIPDSSKVVKYSSVGDANCKLLTLPTGAYTAKTDIADAYRLIPIAPADYPKLGMQFEGAYYYDKCLPQGCSSSCRIFETFSTAIQAILEAQVTGVRCVHMIDDFFLMAADFTTCDSHLKSLLALCADLGVPMSPNKTTIPSTNTTFLGIELDTITRTAKLPIDKLVDYSQDLRTFQQHKRVRRKELESIIGKLSFATIVVPARPFLRRLIDLLSIVSKPYHYIRLNGEVRADLQTWLHFLETYNGITYFRSIDAFPSDSIHMGSDASKLGFGAVYGKRWVQAPYPPSWQLLHITVLELYPIFVLLHLFGHLLKDSSILFHCDNTAVVAIINKQTSKDKTVMCIVRSLVLLLVHHNICLKSAHIAGVINVLPDKISRFQVTPQLLLDFGMHPTPTPIPVQILPENFKLT